MSENSNKQNDETNKLPEESAEGCVNKIKWLSSSLSKDNNILDPITLMKSNAESSKDATTGIDASAAAAEVANNKKMLVEENTEKFRFDDLDNLDNFTIIGSKEEVYPVKVPKYKEIKHYIKGEKLGHGKFGVVREFIDKRTLKRFAGKIIRCRMVEKDCHLRRQINKELTITYHFDHPNIMRVYDIFVNKYKMYMFMEFCYGELGEFLKFYKTIPRCQSKDYFAQILEGLDYLHSKAIIHRDIKPDNILISHGNIIKLADFGVCQEISLFSSEDNVGGIDGTPLYHPPEVFNTEINDYSGTKIDIWAAGVVLYQMLSGELPFFNRPTTTKDDIDDLLTKNIDYPAEIRADILLVDLLNKIFEKDFRKRISISKIKINPWMQIDHDILKTESPLTFPTETRDIDCYRGLTVMTRIHEKYYPQPEPEKRVNYKDSEDSRQQRPLVRSSRIVNWKRKKNPAMNSQRTLNFIY